MTTFTDTNGAPLAAGCVSFYVPSTSTPKDTFQDAAQTQLNTNPVQLDASGRALIYGTGVYRQLVKASPCGSLGVTIWDQLTTDTSSAITIYAGASSGTPNAIAVNAPGFSGADGQIINYISTSTNTGGSTINPSGFGAVQIVRDSATGPGALTGGELVATNSVSLIYDATAGTFHILSPVTWPNTSGVPVGTTIAVSGFAAPTNYAFAYGQAVSRTSFPVLLAALTSAQSGTLSSGSPIVTGLADISQLGFGDAVEGVGIPAGATVQSCALTTCTLSANATVTRTGTVTFFAYGGGDGSTTFNLPDYRGRMLVGRDTMGGAAATVTQVGTTLTTTSGSPSATFGAIGNVLAAGMTIVDNANVPPGTTVIAVAGSALTMSANATGTGSNVFTRFSPLTDAQMLGAAGGSYGKLLQAVETPVHVHANTLTDPGHVHAVTDPGHSHTKTDPGHSHGVTDPGHSHTKTDPGHTHAVTDPGHSHGITQINGATVMSTAGGASNFAAGAFGPISTAQGFTINSATTGLTVNSNTTGITYASAVTGLTVNSNTTGITYASAVTGLTVNSNVTGMSINNASAGGGQAFQLIGPVRSVNWAIRLTP